MQDEAPAEAAAVVSETPVTAEVVAPAPVLISLTPQEACNAIEEAVTVGHTHERQWWLDRLAVIRAAL